MDKKVVIKSSRTAYDANEVSTMTVNELIAKLREYDGDAKVVFSHDGGYMFSGVTENNFAS